MKKLQVTEMNLSFQSLDAMESVYSFMKAKKDKGDFVFLFLDNVDHCTVHSYGDDLFFYTDRNDAFLDAIVTSVETGEAHSVKELYNRFAFLYINRPDTLVIPTLPDDSFPKQYYYEE